MLISDAKKALGIPAEEVINTRSTLRKYYLQAALTSHPDKNPDDSTSTYRFASLQEAYSLLLAHVEADVGQGLSDGDFALCSKQEVLRLLRRAFQGENVENDLKRLGVHRPSPLFGIDLHVRFHQSSELRKNKVSSSHEACNTFVGKDESEVFQNIQCRDTIKNVDIKTVLIDAFHQEGLDEEGNPLEGWSRQADDEECF